MARERDRPDVQEQRATFLAHQPQLDATRLVFVDEAGFRLGSPPLYGWAPRGQPALGRVVRGRWETVTMLGAIALDGFRGFMTVNAGTGNAVFQAFVAHQLVPQLRPGEIVVMDNLAAHHNRTAVQLIEAAGCTVLFLPPYSPEYNPIERTWSKIKTALRRAETLCREAFDQAVATAMDQVSCADIHAWTRLAGYTLNSM